MRKFFEDIVNEYDGSTRLVLLVIFGLALCAIIVGCNMLLAWITMLVYNVLAGALGWPVFSIWFWFGVVTIVGWFLKLTKKKGE